MAFVEDAARSLNVRALHLKSSAQNATALEVYRKLGFKERHFPVEVDRRNFSKPEKEKRAC
jgi:hypothetical protein